MTSGAYERYYEVDGVRYHHIVDPRTGYPSRASLRGITLIGASALELDALPGQGVPEMRRRLGALWGIGPWTTEYMLLRGYGYADVAPVGDSGLRQGLQRFFRLDQAPNDEKAAELMGKFAPYRSLATHHLWRHWTK